MLHGQLLELPSIFALIHGSVHHNLSHSAYAPWLLFREQVCLLLSHTAVTACVREWLPANYYEGFPWLQ